MVKKKREENVQVMTVIEKVLAKEAAAREAGPQSKKAPNALQRLLSKDLSKKQQQPAVQSNAVADNQ